MNKSDLDWFAARLAIGIHEINRGGRAMLIEEMREGLKEIPGFESLKIEYGPSGHQKLRIGNKILEVGPMASNEEIRAALLNPFVRTENTKMSISGYEPGQIRAKLDALKQQGKQRRDAALAKLEQAGSKHEAVS